MLESSIFTKYTTGSKICGKIYKELKLKIENGESSISELVQYGDNRLNEELASIYKNNVYKCIAVPVCISIDNYIENNRVGEIKSDSVIKIDLGVVIDECTSILGETFSLSCDYDKQLNFLDTLQTKLVKVINEFRENYHDDSDDEENILTNDELRIVIESKCTENDVFPVENCKSYQVDSEDPVNMILNYKKVYDKDDNLITENDCFELETDQVYLFNLSITDAEDYKIKGVEGSRLVSVNEECKPLRLQSSNTFYKMAKNKYKNNIFDVQEYIYREGKEDVKNKLAILNCIRGGTLVEYPIRYLHPTESKVFSKKFVIIIREKDCYVLKHF
jgi:hypothetical protein